MSTISNAFNAKSVTAVKFVSTIGIYRSARNAAEIKFVNIIDYDISAVDAAPIPPIKSIVGKQYLGNTLLKYRLKILNKSYLALVLIAANPLSR